MWLGGSLFKSWENEPWYREKPTLPSENPMVAHRQLPPAARDLSYASPAQSVLHGSRGDSGALLVSSGAEPAVLGRPGPVAVLGGCGYEVAVLVGGRCLKKGRSSPHGRAAVLHRNISVDHGPQGQAKRMPASSALPLTLRGGQADVAKESSTQAGRCWRASNEIRKTVVTLWQPAFCLGSAQQNVDCSG
ncbi:hypothetical protein CC78DRAFT_545700 [Lojkania enalia]|uniref:Uncharacterized protein n=1 Tax=Lojkania enalia TaxID=147567 RepID=A0A9P4N7N2_9PLEO|nr:hypothetical protein CC78DRAFT_545700 [Didymosphaeria enalia]